MKKLIKHDSMQAGRILATIPSLRSKVVAAAIILTVAITGCKKASLESDRDYGYAKVTVACDNKCHVSYGIAGSMNEYDVESTLSTYSIRYQRNYPLDITITPLNADQTVTLNVYSREEKQIFRNVSARKVNEAWNSKILIP